MKTTALFKHGFAFCSLLVIATSLTACATHSVSKSGQMSESVKPNIVFIMTDDLGYGDLGCYGAKQIPTPRIDAFASESLLFTQAYATAATCTPTRYSVMTGDYPWRQTQRQNSILDGDAPLAIDLGQPTLPSVLKDAGYTTALIGKWHLGIGDGKNPVDFNGHVGPGPIEVGFDSAFYIPATVDRVPCVYIEDHAVYNLDPADPIQISYLKKVGNDPTGRERLDLLKYGADNQHSDTIVNGISRIGHMAGGNQARWVDEDITDVLTDRAVSFIEANSDKPFFLCLGTHDPHKPHLPHDRFIGKSGVGLRGDSIVQIDWIVGEVLDALDKAGIADNTIVILTSDNGPVLFDGYYDGSTKDNGDHKSAGVYRGHKYLVYEGGTRVPFIVRWPDAIAPGETDELLSLADMLPTLADASGAKPAGVDGINMLPSWTGTGEVLRSGLATQGVMGGFAIRQGDWKFIPANAEGVADDIGRGADPRDKRFAEAKMFEDQLYYLVNDPAETRNVIADYPDLAESLQVRLNELLGK